MKNLKRVSFILFTSLTIMLFPLDEVKATTLDGENADIQKISEAVKFAEIVTNIESNSEIIGNKKIVHNEETSELEQKKILEPKEEVKTKKGKKRTISKKEYDDLCRIVESEATGEGLKGKILVANVIFNRYDTGSYKSITNVIFEKKQFSPIRDGRFYSVKVTEETIKAIDSVLDGTDYSQGALYFMVRKHSNADNVTWFDNSLTFLFKYGNHEFFK